MSDRISPHQSTASVAQRLAAIETAFDERGLTASYCERSLTRPATLCVEKG